MKVGDRVRIGSAWGEGTIQRISGNAAAVHWDDDAWSTLLLVELRPVAAKRAEVAEIEPSPRVV